MPAQLKELMRHQNISTTMEFYVGKEAKQTAKRLRVSHANNFANSTDDPVKSDCLNLP